MASVKSLKIAFQKNSDSTVYATWSWTHKHTKEYSIEWQYTTGNGVWFTGSTSTETRKQSTYSFPNNALNVRVKVKPISTTYKKKITTKTKKGKKTTKSVETNYWKATKKTSSAFNVVKYKLPSQPSAPTLSLEEYVMTIKLEHHDENTSEIQFQVYHFNANINKFKSIAEILKDNQSSVIWKLYRTITATRKASGFYEDEVAIPNRGTCVVRCRGKNSKGAYGDWSNWSEMIEAPPEQVLNLSVKANSTDSVMLKWDSVINAKTYKIEYTSQYEYFDSGSDQVFTKDGIESTYTYINGLDRSKQWLFRVKAVNASSVESLQWSKSASIVIGTKPNPPSTWSSALSVMVGDPVTLYWIHNTEDGSSQTDAQIHFQRDSGEEMTLTIPNNRSDEDKDKTSSYELDVRKLYDLDIDPYTDSINFTWAVRTRGITEEYSDWSIRRNISIYAYPTMDITVTTPLTSSVTEINKLPIGIICHNQSDGQTPIGYYITVSPTTAFVTIDNNGEEKIVNAGEILYSKYIDDMDDPNTVAISLGPGDIALENDLQYKITANMTLDSGLHCEESVQISVAIEDSGFTVDAEISIDDESLSAYITPYCLNASTQEAVEITQEEDGDEPNEPDDMELVSDVLLSVYRREFDGTFTLISSNIKNTLSKTVIDPHPSLDYARYRIVGTVEDTGEKIVYDVPGVYIGNTSLIIQWNEQWSDFNRNDPDPTDEPTNSGSIIELPYNVDISESYDKDVALVEYIGRRSPVSYYGTQISEGGSWTTDIPKSDKDTIYALRRLAVYQGDVYIREPSGLGYWAQVSVSFSQKHNDLIVPVTLNVTRVEGDGI